MAQPRRAEELLEHYSDSDFRVRFAYCWAVREVLGDCVLSDDWVVPDPLAESLVLSSDGKEWATWLVSEGVDWSTATVAVATAFARESLFVDVEKTNVEELLAAVSSEVAAERIRIPHPFGREPDDMFGRRFGEWRETLTRDETRAFLDKLDQGVGQIGNVVFGPLGALISEESRWVDVSRIGAGFYCTDPGCSQLHPVRLVTGQSRPAEALEKLHRELNRAGRRYSEWGHFFRRLTFPESVWQSDRFTHGLPALVGNCLSDVERSDLLAYLLRSGGAIRSAIRSSSPESDQADKYAEEIVEAISPNAVTQCILVESDRAVVEAIEILVREERIIVPATETRRSRFSRSYVASGLLESRAELSSIGVRFLPRRRSGLDQLRSFFRELYTLGGSMDELEWKLRGVTGDSPAERLNSYLLSVEPAEVLRALVFDSPTRLKVALELVGPGAYDAQPMSSAAEQQLVRSMLWKLGVDVNTYPESLSRFHDRRRKFAASAKSGDGLPPESDRDEIRGAGSNLFVALEEVLDAALSFSSWALTFDHFGARRNRFQYTLADARREGFGFINRHTAEGKSQLDLAGVNTLEPLSAGFARLADALRAVDQEPSLYERTSADLPQWAENSPLEVFPFRHTVPWLDLTRGSRIKVLDLLDGVPRVLSRADVARVRNQTAHRRDDFPTGTEVRQVCAAVGNLVADLEESGLAPDVFARRRSHTDAFGRGVAVLADYFDREVELATPSEIRRSGVPSSAVPQVIFRCGVIEGTSEPLRFSVIEDSEFRRMWLEWPNIVQAPVRQPESSSPGGHQESVGSIDLPSLEPAA